MRTFRLLLSCIFFFISLVTVSAQTATSLFENVIQINGVTMTADSLRGVPGVIVEVKNKNRGVETNGQGVFSIVVYKGDTLLFSSLGFRSKEYVVPQNVKGNYLSLIQLMVQDTFYLPETIVRPYLSKEEFEYAFKYEKIPDDRYEIARKNTDAQTMRILAYILPKDGGENQAAYQNIQANNAVYYGIQRPMNVFNPLAWAAFYEAWKRGDYRRKKYR
jgi:hypothetical protein